MPTIPIRISPTEGYDSIQLSRSDEEAGTFVEITAGAEAPAVITGTESGPFRVSAYYIEIYVDDYELKRVYFSGSNPLDAETVAEQINDVFGFDLASVDAQDRIVLTSRNSGPSGYLMVRGGNAVTYLGFEAGAAFVGYGPNVQMYAGKHFYTYNDTAVEEGWYRWRQVASDEYQYEYGYASPGPWSDALYCPVTRITSDAEMSIGYLVLYDSAGVPVANREVVIYPMVVPTNTLSQLGVVAAGQSPVRALTDDAGHVQFSLVRGTKIRVTIEATQIIRELTVPDQQSFDLLTYGGEQADVFNPLDFTPPLANRSTT